jgi:myosin protein heavy chain
MKKKESVNSNEVYVIKMPIGDKTYPSIDKALEECRSHLIS